MCNPVSYIFSFFSIFLSYSYRNICRRDGEYSHDLAMVRLAGATRLSRAVGTVCLPARGIDLPPGTTCTVSGWGKTDCENRIIPSCMTDLQN